MNKRIDGLTRFLQDYKIYWLCIIFFLFTGWWQVRARLLGKGLWYFTNLFTFLTILAYIFMINYNQGIYQWLAVFLGIFTSIDYFWRHSYLSGWDVLTERKWRYIHLCRHRSIHKGNQGVCPDLFVLCQFKFKQQVYRTTWYRPMISWYAFAVYILGKLIQVNSTVA